MPRRGRGLSADKYLEVSLSGNAQRLAREDVPRARAVDELRALATGRADLLAEAGGRIIGSWLASPGTHHPAELRAGALLVEAGADPETVARWVDEGRANATGGGHSTPV